MNDIPAIQAHTIAIRDDAEANTFERMRSALMILQSCIKHETISRDTVIGVASVYTHAGEIRQALERPPWGGVWLSLIHNN
jgi:hypothetical protein